MTYANILPEVGRRLTDKERETSRKFVDWLYEQSGCGSYAEFAARAGTSAPSLSDWHRGKNTPSLTNVMKLIGVAGILDGSAPVERSSSDEVLERVEAVLAESRGVDALQVELLRELTARSDDLAARLAAHEEAVRDLAAEVRGARPRAR